MLDDLLRLGFGGLAALVGVSAIPAAFWLSTRERARRAWPPQQVGTRVVDGQYRAAEVPTYGAEGPPRAVLLAALGCWGLGQMFVPGLLAGLYGMLVLIGVVSIPGLVLAWRNFFLGSALLRGAPEAAAKARDLARFTVVLNAIVILVTTVLTAGYALTESNPWRVSGGPLLLAAGVLFYAGVSLAHAALLRRAAVAIDALHGVGAAGEAVGHDARTGVRVALEAAAAGAAPGEAALVERGFDGAGQRAGTR